MPGNGAAAGPGGDRATDQAMPVLSAEPAAVRGDQASEGRLCVDRDVEEFAQTSGWLTPGTVVHGLLADAPVEIVQVAYYGSAAIKLTYRRADGQVQEEVLYRADEERLRIEAAAEGWAPDADPALLGPTSEAMRLRPAHLFDP